VIICVLILHISRLPDFLGQMLQCTSIRLRTKIKTGKQVYHSRSDHPISKVEYEHIMSSIYKLSVLYEAWLKKLREENVLVSTRYLLLQKINYFSAFSADQYILLGTISMKGSSTSVSSIYNICCNYYSTDYNTSSVLIIC